MIEGLLKAASLFAVVQFHLKGTDDRVKSVFKTFAEVRSRMLDLLNFIAASFLCVKYNELQIDPLPGFRDMGQTTQKPGRTR